MVKLVATSLKVGVVTSKPWVIKFDSFVSLFLLSFSQANLI